MKKAEKDAQAAAGLEALKECIQVGSRIYYTVTSVAASGMSRHMKFFMVRDGEIKSLTHAIAAALALKWNGDGSLTISGCGMDMGFHVVYTIGRMLWPEGDGKTVTGRNGDKGPETDGGYLLKYSYL